MDTTSLSLYLWVSLKLTCVPPMMYTGHDVIAQAQSGTGKTATFSISVLQKIDTSVRQCQALLLAPTRELAQQIQKVRYLPSDGCATVVNAKMQSGGMQGW